MTLKIKDYIPPVPYYLSVLGLVQYLLLLIFYYSFGYYNILCKHIVYNIVSLCLHPLPHVFQNVQMEEAGISPRPETPSTLTETEGEMEGSLLEVDLDSYQTTLEEVLTWLLSAEDALQIQDEVSDDVEEVKEQFHTHEVGGDLRVGLRLVEM